jgi:hypothetical protein
MYFFIPAAAAPYFKAELEKLAGAQKPRVQDPDQADLSLDLKDTPRAFGIRAKKTGQDERGIAYTQGMGAAAVGGAATGAAAAATTGRASQLSLLRPGVAEEALAQGSRDYGVFQRAASRASAAGGLAGGVAAAKSYAAGASNMPQDAVDAVRWAANGGSPAQGKAVREGTVAGISAAAKELADPALREVLARRGKAALKGAALISTAGAGLKGLYNATQYEAAKTLTTKPVPRQKQD